MDQDQVAEVNWEEMHPDVLLRIFSTFSLLELVLNISSVCKPWRSICYSPSLWKSIDLTELDNFIQIPVGLRVWSNSERFWQILKHFVNLSNEHLNTMVFHLFIGIGDRHLAYTARRYDIICGTEKLIVF